MNNISSVKVTLGVVFATAATFIVNAYEIMPAETALTEKAVELKNEVAVESSSFLENSGFAKLLSEFDQDENGTLSQAELSSSDNEALKIAFKHLDSNEDENISEDEFSTYTQKKLK